MTILELEILERQWRDQPKRTAFRDAEDMGLTVEDFQEKLDSLNDQITRLERYMDNKKHFMLKNFEKKMKEQNINPDTWEDRIGLEKAIYLDKTEKELTNLYEERARIVNTMRHLGGDKSMSNSIEKAKTYPIEQLIDSPIKLVSGKKWALCPFHSERKPSFFINEKNVCHCFSCGFHGDSIELAQKLFNLSFKEALERLA